MLINSVPTKPAFASESEFVGRALERVSSFRAGLARARDPGDQTGGAVRGRRNGEAPGGGLLFLSFLIALGAVLWALTISLVFKVLKALVGRLISS